jgi:hypothetical protein
MKMIAGKTVLIAVLVSAMPLGLYAGAAASVFNSASRDVSRLTLLTGPNLTSRAPNAGLPAPVPAPLVFVAPTEPGTFQFVPGPAPATNILKNQGAGTLTLGTFNESGPLQPQPTPLKALPSPETLRFDRQLPAPNSPGTAPGWRLGPAPKRDAIERRPE